MAFAAVHPQVGRIDATLDDLGCGLAWSQVHKVAPRVALSCPGCGYGVHAKVSPRKLRYFAHDPGRPGDCAWLNESLEHHLLKLELATAIRAAGWHAELEVRAADGAWRADVLASAHDGSVRMAWEAQLSPITDEDLVMRTARYAQAGIRVCWVTPSERVSCLGVVPALRVRETQRGQIWLVTDGVFGFSFEDGAWVRKTGFSLNLVVDWVLHAKTVCHAVLPRYRRVHLADAGRVQSRRAMVWTTTPHIQSEARHEVKRQRQDAWKQRRQEQEERAHQARQQQARLEREERARNAEREAASARIRAEERQRQWELEAEERKQERARQEAELRRRREAEERERAQEARQIAAERERREHEEQAIAGPWHADMSPAQVQELLNAIAAGPWMKRGARLVVDSHGPIPEYAYGTAVSVNRQLYGIVRPRPGVNRRLPTGVRVFVRNAREAAMIRENFEIQLDLVIHFDMPDHEQMSLLD